MIPFSYEEAEASTEKSSNLSRATVAEPYVNPGRLALNLCSLLPFPHKGAGQNPKVFNVEACPHDLCVGEDFFWEGFYVYHKGTTTIDKCGYLNMENLCL